MSAIALPSEETQSSLSKLTDPNPQADPAADPIANRGSKSAIPPSEISNLRFQIPKTSTGPRSPEGKFRSAQNAAKHHLSATNPPPHLEANPTYQISKREFQEEFNPQTPAQCVLVNELTFTAWKLHQIPHLEHQILSTPLGQTQLAVAPQVHEPINPETYLFDRLSNDDDNDTQEPPPQDSTNQITATHFLQNTPTPLTRLWDYHRRLQARFQSLIRQIQQLKRQEQSRREQADKKDRQQRQADHDALSQCVDEIRQRNKAREEAARMERRQAAERQPHQSAANIAPAQNELSQSEISNPESEILPTQHSKLSTQHSPPAPAQNELPQQSQIANRKSESSPPSLSVPSVCSVVNQAPAQTTSQFFPDRS